jgi:hypothetical protein
MSQAHDTVNPSSVLPGEGRSAVAELLVLFCPSCAQDCFAETPPCPDGHGESCPDRACVECGTALMLDAPLVELVRSARSAA